MIPGSARALTVLLAVGLLGAGVASAQGPMDLPRLSGPITLDGRLDEPAWESLPALPMAVYEPVHHKAPAERTELRVAYDDGALYVAARLSDSRPDDVRGNSLYRDQYQGDDTVGLIVDAFNDQDTALWFYTTPTGTRVDGAVVADMASGEADWSWNGHWEAAAVRTPDGWTAEMRIPFSTLGFQDDGGQVVMGLSAYRWLARHSERHIWPDVPPRWPRAYARPSLLQDVVLRGVDGRRAVYVAPYTLGGYTQRPRPGQPRTLGLQRRGLRADMGVDAKLGVSSNTTLDITVNTDFAQAEADDEQVNLTRFPLFFPEKRQFFLERASVFSFGLSGDGRLFNSRSIGLVDGQPVPLLGGARLVGRMGAWDFGLLDMQALATDTQPTENLGVLRVRRQLGDPRSSVGMMLTTRLDGDGRSALAYGVDSVLRVVGDEYLSVKWAQSTRWGRASAADLEEGAPSGRGGRLLVDWQRRRAAGLSYRLGLNWVGDGYVAPLGFEPRRDVRWADGALQYEWLLSEASPLRRIRLGTTGEVWQRNADRVVETGLAEPFLRLESQGGSELALSGALRTEDVASAFLLGGGAEIPAGRYSFQRARAEYAMAGRYRLRTALAVEAGGLYDGRSVGVSLRPTWNASRHLNVSAEYRLDAFRAPERDAALDSHLFRLRLQLALDPRLSLSTLAQYSSVVRRASFNARLRYHVREGQDFWLVYDERLTRDLSDPAERVAPQNNNRALLLKYTHTLVW
jgi:hypothetical protein